MCFLPLSFILFYPIPPIIFVFPSKCFLFHSAVKSTFAVSKIYFPDGIQHFLLFSVALYRAVLSSWTYFFAWEWCWRLLFIVLQAGTRRTAAQLDSKFMRLSQWCTMGNWGCKLSWMKLQSPMYVPVTHISVLYLEDRYLTSLSCLLYSFQNNGFPLFLRSGWRNQSCPSWKVTSVTAGAGSL